MDNNIKRGWIMVATAKDEDTWIAVTLMGGFSGSGETKDLAIKMARGRLMADIKRGENGPVNYANRITPALRDLAGGIIRAGVAPLTWEIEIA